MIKEKKNKNFEQKVKIDFSLLLIIRENFEDLKKNLSKNFCDFFFFVCKERFYDKKVLEKKIEKIENAFIEFFVVNENENEDIFFEEYFEIEENDNYNKSDLYDINFDFKSIIKNLQIQFSYFLSKLTRLKNNFDFKIFNSNYNDFKIFNDIFHNKMNKLSQLNRIFKNSDDKCKKKINFLKKQNLEKEKKLKEKIDFCEKLSILNEKIINENRNLKDIVNKLLKKKKNLKEKLNKVESDFSKLSENLIKKKIFITLINKKKIHLNNTLSNLSEQKNFHDFLNLEKSNFIYSEKKIDKNDLLNFPNFSNFEKNNFFKGKIMMTSKNSEKYIKSLKDKIEMGKNVNTIKISQNQKEEENCRNNNEISTKKEITKKKNKYLIKNLSKISLSNSFFNKNSDFSIRYSISNSIFVKKDKKENCKNLKNCYMPKTSQKLKTSNLFENLKSINNIIKPETPKKSSQIFSNFKDFGFLCEKSKKHLSLIEFDEEKIMIQNFSDRKKKIIIQTKRLIFAEISKKSPFLLKIIFHNSCLKKQSLLLECPNTPHLLQVLKNSKYFSENLIKKKNFFEIEKNFFFNDCSLNLFYNPTYCGLVRQYVNSLFYNWKVIFLIFIGKVLLKFEIPSVVCYKKGGLFRKISIFQLENFNFVKSTKGIEVPNLFALKFGGREEDLVIATPAKFQFNNWLESFYNIYDYQVC